MARDGYVRGDDDDDDDDDYEDEPTSPGEPPSGDEFTLDRRMLAWIVFGALVAGMILGRWLP